MEKKENAHFFETRINLQESQSLLKLLCCSQDPKGPLWI